MSGSWTVRRSRRSLAVLFAAAMTCLVAVPATAVAQDEPPVISNASVTPGSLPYTGGTVEIGVDISDVDNDVETIWVEINGPVQNESIGLAALGGSSYQGFFGVPGNFTPDPVSYSFTVFASDQGGHTSEQFAGEVAVDGEPQFDEFPAVFDPSISPSTVSSAGGPVTLAVSATDLRGISEAYAVVQGGLTGIPHHVPLEPTSSTRFEGTFVVPVHTGSSATTYDVDFSALDDIGQQTTIDGGQILVLGRPAAPLTLSASLLDFGSVRVGRNASRTLVLTNTGPKGTAPVEGVILAPAAPFSLNGAGADGIPFRLKPGQKKNVVVRFRPTATGAATGAVVVERTDAAQPGLQTALQGTGVG